MIRKFVFTLVLVVFLFAAPALRLCGQSGASVVEGTVQDATGAVIQSSDVVLLNDETGGKSITRTNGDGVYLFPSVQPGVYSLEISKPGFKPYSITHFRVTVSQRATQNVVLSLGSATATVTVDAAGSSSLWEPTSNELGTLIEQSNVRDLPLNGRDFLQLGLLSGATQTSGTTVSDFTTLQVGHPDRTIIIDGIEQDLTGFVIDGISTAGSRLGQASLNLSVAAIDQFKIHEGFFLPSEGPNDAGVVSVVSKGGSNNLHGEAFEFVRNTAFDTRMYFDKPGADPSPFHRNQFGGAAGGPILHNRVFFFGHYEGRRQVQSNTAHATVPSTKMLQGDFSELSTTIYDPNTYDASTGLRQPFPKNYIDPNTRFNSMAKKLLAYYVSAPTYGSQNLSGNPVTTDNYDQYGGRIDVNLSAKNVLFGQYVNENSPSHNNALFPLAGYGFPLNTNLVMSQLTTTLTPHVVNEFRLGWIRPSVFTAGDTQNGVQGQLGFTGTADPNGVPGIFLSGFNVSGATSSTPSFGRSQGLIGNIDNQFQLHESMSLLKGKHELSFGVDLNYIRTVQESSNFFSRGGVYFNPIYTAQLAPNSTGQLAPVTGTGNSLADFLLGYPQSGTVTSMPRTNFRWTATTPYVQDTWRIHPNLTINAGLGWNMSTPPNAVGSDKNYPHAFNFKTGKVEYAALGAVSPEVYKIDLNNFAPRVGIAWQPKFLPSTIIRAGGGIYYPAENAIYELFAITAPGVAIVQSITNSSAVTPTYVLGQNVFPPMTQTTITQTFADNVSGTLFSLDTNLRSTYIEQWSLGIQHNLTKSTIAEVDYIGSQSRKLPIRWNADDCSQAGTLLCDATVRPYKQFNYIYAAANEGSSSYNAFVAKIQRQFSNGLSFVTNYTWSKVLSNTEQGGAPVGLNQRGTCLSCDRGMAGYNAPQRLVASGVWNLPLGRGKQYLNGVSPALDHIVGGWTVDAIATFSQGNPFTVLAASSTTMDPMTQYRANRLCDGRSSLKNKDVRSNGHYWFDTACFAVPATNYFGNSGTNILTGPGVNNWDIGAGKLIALRESINLQFRADAFNAFNHAQFLNPDSNMADTNFGKVTTTGLSRELQLSMKLLW
jgi:hypothetical protein